MFLDFEACTLRLLSVDNIDNKYNWQPFLHPSIDPWSISFARYSDKGLAKHQEKGFIWCACQQWKIDSSSVTELIQGPLVQNNNKWKYPPVLHLPGGSTNLLSKELHNGKFHREIVRRFSADNVKHVGLIKLSSSQDSSKHTAPPIYATLMAFHGVCRKYPTWSIRSIWHSCHSCHSSKSHLFPAQQKRVALLCPDDCKDQELYGRK